jgi:hypothetical protein
MHRARSASVLPTRSHGFTTEEVPTTRLGKKRVVDPLYGEDAIEPPTTLRPSSIVPVRRRSRRPTPPLSKLLPRARIRSLASILEPEPEAELVITPRPALLPPDPEAFRPPPPLPPPSRVWVRWAMRIALLSIIVVGELVLADPTGALHSPRDVEDAGSMLSAAIRASASHALDR